VSRQPDFSTTPRPARLPRWDTALLVLGAVALAASAAATWRERDAAGDATRRAAEVRREVEQQAARVRALSAPGAGEGPARATSGASPARIVAAVAAVLPPDVRLERLTIDYAHGALLEMGVEARNAAGWDRLLERLERSAAFAEVAPGPESREAEVRTVVRARWAGGAP
jgi:hypothetical protein